MSGSMLACATEYAKAQQNFTMCTVRSAGDDDMCTCLHAYNESTSAISSDPVMQCSQTISFDANLTARCAELADQDHAAHAAAQATNGSGMWDVVKRKAAECGERAHEFWNDHRLICIEILIYVGIFILIFLSLRGFWQWMKRTGRLGRLVDHSRSVRTGCFQSAYEHYQELVGFFTWCRDAISATSPSAGGARDEKDLSGFDSESEEDDDADLAGSPLERGSERRRLRDRFFGRGGGGRDPDRGADGGAPGKLWSGWRRFGSSAHEDLRHKEDQAGGPMYWQPPYYDAVINNASGHHVPLSHPGSLARPLPPSGPEYGFQGQGPPWPSPPSPGVPGTFPGAHGGAPFGAPPASPAASPGFAGSARARMPFPGGMM